VLHLTADNNRQVPVALLSGSIGGDSAQSRSRHNTEVLEVLEAQGGKHRRGELVRHPQMVEAARTELFVPAAFGPAASVDLRISQQFTWDQLSALRRAGFGLASDAEMRAEEASRQLTMSRATVRLEVSRPRDNEAHECEHVRSTCGVNKRES